MASCDDSSCADGVPPPRLVGRDREQHALLQQLDVALSGRGRVVLISGAAGIGKTALCEALGRMAAVSGALVLTGYCFDLTTTPPYGLWLELLSTLHGTDGEMSLPDALTNPTRLGHLKTQTELFADVWAALTELAHRRPVVLILEDLHWADVASIELLRFVARHVSSHHMLLLVTYRPEELTRRQPFFQRLPALVRECQAMRVDLKPLHVEALRDLVRTQYHLAPAEESSLVRYLEQHSEGNPFYFNELLRALEEESVLSLSKDGWRLGDLTVTAIPPLILQVIQTRLGRLSTKTTALLAVAAVIGQEVPLEIWSRVGEAGDEELADVVEQVSEAHLLVEVPGRATLRFTHALVREALYGGVPLPRRRAWHRRTAELLAGELPTDPDQVAFHYQQAADPRAVDWLIRAGEKAQLLYAPHAAIDSFTAALTVAGVLDHPRRLVCHQARGLAYATIGEFRAAQADAEATLELARIDGNRTAEWQALLDLGMLWASRNYTRTREYYLRALDVARDIDAPTMIARSLNRLGNWHMNIDQPGVAKHYHQEALTTFRTLSDRRGMAETLDFLGATMSLSGDLRQTAACYQEAIELFHELDDRQGLASALATSAERGGSFALGALIPTETLAHSRLDAEAAVQVARAIGWRAGEAYALIEVGIVLNAQGEFGRALTTLHDAVRIAKEIEHRQWLSVAYTFLGNLYDAMLATSQAREHYEQAIALSRQVHSVVLERFATIFLALALIRQGELAKPGRLLDSIAETETDPANLTHIVMRLARAELALVQRDPDSALRIVEQLLVDIPNVEPGRAPLWPAILHAEALLALGRWDEAEADLRATIRDAAYQGAQLLLMRAHLTLGALYQAQTRIAATDHQQAEAQAIIDELAETIPDDELRANFRRRTECCLPSAQAGSSRTSTMRAFGLSRRELEVLRLVSEGLTDAEVAARLYISRRTVTSHLTSIYTKLGVSTRTAAARLAVDQAIV